MRSDVLLYNEANGFVVAAADLAGRAHCDEDAGELWNSGVAAGAFLPIELVQDDPQILRIVIGESLLEQEAAEWIARVESSLDLSCGEMVIAAGSDYISNLDHRWLEENGAIYRLKVAPGKYRLRVDTHLPGTNGLAAAELSRGMATAYWQRTRPGEEMPGWLRYLEDPSFSWGESKPPSLVGFLIHLERLVGSIACPELEHGYPRISEGKRIPHVCPPGLPCDPVPLGRHGEREDSFASVSIPEVYGGPGTHLLDGKAGVYSLASGKPTPMLQPVAAKTDQEMAAAGFRLVGEINNDRLGGATLRVFLGPGEDIYAVSLLGMFGDMGATLYSRFSDGTWLTTSNRESAEDDEARSLFRQPCPGASMEELDRVHCERQHALSATHGGLLRVDPHPVALAKLIDEFASRSIG